VKLTAEQIERICAAAERGEVNLWDTGCCYATIALGRTPHWHCSMDDPEYKTIEWAFIRVCPDSATERNGWLRHSKPQSRAEAMNAIERAGLL
jgi:hypothetical protein